MDKIKIGIVGLGGIANQHINELLNCQDAVITAICDVSEKAIEEKNKILNLPPNKCYTDYNKLIADEDVDAIEICTINSLHAPVAIASLKAGKPVNLEKPIAMNYDEALAILDAAKNCKKSSMTCFSYRFKPAVRFAKHLIDEGNLGKIVGLNVSYLKDSGLWDGRELEWRFIKKYASSGVIGDLGVHLIDLAELLAGKIAGLFAIKETVVTQRKKQDNGEFSAVETEDMCGFVARFENGANATFHITRAAAGYKNTIRYDVYGTRGAISFDLDNPDKLNICMGEGDVKDMHFKCVDVPKEFYMTQERCFVNSQKGEIDFIFPSLENGAESQKIVDALLKSAEEKRWIDIER